MRKPTIKSRIVNAKYHRVWSGRALVPITRKTCLDILRSNRTFTWSVSKDNKWFYLSFATDEDCYTTIEFNEYKAPEQFELIESNG